MSTATTPTDTEIKYASPVDYYQKDSCTEARLLQVVEGSKRLPLAEATQILEHILRLPGATAPGDAKEDDIETIKMKIVFNRFANRLCNKCFSGKHTINKHLKLCTGCYSTWYCSRECQLADRSQHSRWCNQRDASPDQGPLAVALVQIKPPPSSSTSTSAPSPSV